MFATPVCTCQPACWEITHKFSRCRSTLALVCVSAHLINAFALLLATFLTGIFFRDPEFATDIFFFSSAQKPIWISVSISCCTCLHGCCCSIPAVKICGVCFACSCPQLSHHSAGGRRTPLSPLPPPLSTPLHPSTHTDKRRLDEGTRSTSGY